MMNPRFFCPDGLVPDCEIPLPAPVAHHAERVLRLVVGDAVVLFDGQGGEFSATLTALGKQPAARLGPRLPIERESSLAITLVQALASGDKMDWVVQKAVELGVMAIQPVAAERSVLKLAGDRAVKRVAHWQGVAAAACEQCGRNQVPQLAPLEKLENWLARPANGALRLILAPDADQALVDLPPAENVQLLIGAEGGLDPQEILAARQVGFTAVKMGPRILRTETAGLAALAVLQALWGDFRGG